MGIVISCAVIVKACFGVKLTAREHKAVAEGAGGTQDAIGIFDCCLAEDVVGIALNKNKFTFQRIPL